MYAGGEGSDGWADRSNATAEMGRSGEVTKNKYFFCVLRWCRRVALADINVLVSTCCFD
jgi:hypothetical protein